MALAPSGSITLRTTPLLLLGLLAGSGCREELRPERFPTASVSGKVVEGGKPVAGGWIEFFPVQGAVGNLRSARIAPDGTFRADRVAVGTNVVRLVNAPIQLPGGSALFGRFSTPVRRVVPDGGSSALTIDLLEEAVRFQAVRSRAQADGPPRGGAQP